MKVWGEGGGCWEAGDAVHKGREPSPTDNKKFSCGAAVIRATAAASASAAPVIIQDIVFQSQRTPAEPKVGRERGGIHNRRG